MAGSVLLRHSELQQQRRRELIEALDRVERQTSTELAALPTRAWGEVGPRTVGQRHIPTHVLGARHAQILR